MATLVVATATRNGVEVVAGAAACAVGGDAFANTGQEIALITNAGGAPVTVSFAVQSTVDGRAVASRSVVVSNASTEAIGPFPMALYNDGSGLVRMTYSSVADLFVKVLKATPA